MYLRLGRYGGQMRAQRMGAAAMKVAGREPKRTAPERPLNQSSRGLASSQ